MRPGHAPTRTWPLASPLLLVLLFQESLVTAEELPIEQCGAPKQRLLFQKEIFQKEVNPRRLEAHGRRVLAVAQEDSVITQEEGLISTASIRSAIRSSRFSIFVPISVARFVMGCFPLGLLYLASLWKNAGVLVRLRSGEMSSAGNFQAVVALSTYLLMLVSMDLAIKYESEKGGGHYTTSPLVMVPMVELGKLLVSLVIYLVWQSSSTSSDAGASKQALAPISAEDAGSFWEAPWVRVALRMFPVALIYNTNNFLVFAVLARVNLDSYAVWRNVSILFNALLWVWVLQRYLCLHRWIALGICLLACCLNSLQLDGRIEFDLAVAGIVLSAFLSSVASVFNEYVIKARAATAITLDQVNMILYVETLSLMLLALLLWTAWDGPTIARMILSHLQNMTSGGLKIISMQIVLGLSVSRVLKFADSVAKTVVGSLRDVVIVFIAPLFVTGTRFDWVAVGSVCWMALSGMIYFTPLTTTPSEATSDQKQKQFISHEKQQEIVEGRK